MLSNLITINNNNNMLEEQIHCSQVYYFMNFSLLHQGDVELLCAYKQFVESTIIELGEDWRIQSGLLSQQIVGILSQQMAEAESPLSERLQFNIFNQFLLPFLKNKLGQQGKVCQMSDSIIQQNYSKQLNSHFYQNIKITDSLTFKTLSLGFCIKAADMWVKNFTHINDDITVEYTFQPLGILCKHQEKKQVIKMGEKSSYGASTIRNNLSNIDLGSCQQSNSEPQQGYKKLKQGSEKKWISLKDMSILSQEQMKLISNFLNTTKSSKTQVISNFAVNIHQVQTSNKKVRIVTTNSEFYRRAFIIWLIFNIKLFFSITFQQYLVYFKKLMKKWVDSLEAPLKKFYTIIQRQWNLLLKDYSVALHDDLEVLRSLIQRVRNNLHHIWKVKHTQICKKFSQ